MTGADTGGGLPKRLPMAKVLLGAILLPWHRRTAFARSIAVPFICQVLLLLAWQYAAASLDSVARWLLYGIHVVLFIMIAVRCHRLMLLDVPTENTWELPKWTWRETRFLGYCMGLWLVFMATMWVAFYPLALPVGILYQGTYQNKIMAYVPYVASLLAYFPMSRLSLVLPASAIDVSGGFRSAWSRSAGNGLRLCVVVGVLPFAISYLLGASYFIEQSFLADLLYVVMANIFVVVEVSALSLAYRELR